MNVEWGRKRIPLSFDLYPARTDDKQIFYEPEVINVFDRFVEPGDCVIDAGASIGLHTCFLGKMVGETGRVLAFEPHLRSYQCLTHHVQANELRNVTCYRMALWREDCASLQLWSAHELGYSSFHRYFNTESSEIVAGRTLGTMLNGYHPRVIKIDCEGTELEVLSGAHEALVRGVDCVIVELNYGLMEIIGRPDSIIREYMHCVGYDMFLISICDENGRWLPPAKIDLWRGITLCGETRHINVLFSTEEKVAKRWT